MATQEQWLAAVESLNAEAENSLPAALKKGTDPLPKGKKPRHHYVPKLWLKGFLRSPEDGHVTVLDASGPATTRDKDKGIGSVACSPEFYTVATEDGGKDRWVEAYLGWLENLATRPEHGRWTNLQQGKTPAEPLDRLLAAQLLSTQHFRVSRFMDTMTGAVTKVMQKIVDTGQAIGALPATEAPLRVKLANAHDWGVAQAVDWMTGHQVPRQMFLRKWRLFESPDDIGWALPVNRSLLAAGGAGLGAPELWAPINRRYVLCMAWDPGDTIPEGPPEVLHPPVAEQLRTGFARSDTQFVVHPEDADAWQDLIDNDQIVMARRHRPERRP